MAKAQGGTVTRVGYGNVGILDNLTEQVALGVGLCASVEGTVAKTQIPIGIIHQPAVVDLVVGIDVEETEMVALFRALNT